MGKILLICGCSINGTFPETSLSRQLISSQQSDGGWSDAEETLWCISYLSTFGKNFREEITQGLRWLTHVQLPCGAWGKTNRDQPRIPITALAAALVPEIIDKKSLAWMDSQWKTDMEGPTQLSYKGAYYLIAQKHSKASLNNNLIVSTTDYLVDEQSDDGGFGLWKDHPVGSDPWTTGIVIWGLSTLGKQAPKSTIERAVSWLETTQLPNGLWPYHHIDDGSSMALMGLSNSLPILMER